MPTKQRQQDDVEEQDMDQEEQEGNGNGSLHINVEGEMIVIELPRDGNEAETLSRLSQFVDGL
jgi:hypothetical protein